MAFEDLISRGYVALDFETTGLDPSKGDQVIQIGAQRYDAQGKPIGDPLDTLVMPTRQIPEKITQLTGISSKSYQTDPRTALPENFIEQSEVAEKLQSYIGDLPVMAYNADFERKFAHKYGALKENKFIDPVPWVRRAFPGKTAKLDIISDPHTDPHGLVSKYGLMREGQAHTALTDVETMHNLVRHALPAAIQDRPRLLEKARKEIFPGDPIAAYYDWIARGMPAEGGITTPAAGGPPIAGGPPRVPPPGSNLPPSSEDPNFGRFHGYRISNRRQFDVAHSLREAIGKRGYTINQSAGAPEGYQRLVIEHKDMGFYGQKAMIIDVALGADSALQEEPAILLRTRSSTGLSSHAVIGAKASKKRGDWELYSPVHALADVVQASFRSAQIKEFSPFSKGLITPSDEVFPILSSDSKENRHAIARKEFQVPEGALMLTHMASQGEQVQAARNVGVFFDTDPTSKDSEWLQIRRQKSEIEDNLLSLKGDWETLFHRGLYGFSQGEDKRWRLEWIADTKIESIQELGYQLYAQAWYGADKTDRLKGIEAMIKHAKGMSMIARARYGPEPMEQFTADDERGPYQAYRPIEPISIKEAVEQYGERYWEKQEEIGKPIIVESGLVLPGEERPRNLQVGRALFTNTPFPGAALVDQAFATLAEAYGEPKAEKFDLEGFMTTEDLMDASYTFKGSIQGMTYQAMSRRNLTLGSIAMKGQTRPTGIKVGGKGYDMQVRGGRLVIPGYFDPRSKMLYPHAIEHEGKYYADEDHTQELWTTEALAKALEEKFEGKGITVERSSQRGVFFELDMTSLVGGSPKFAAVKGGPALVVGSRHMAIEGPGRETHPIDLATGEAKQITETMMNAFGVLSFQGRLDMLRMIRGREVGGRTIQIGDELARFASEKYSGTERMFADELTQKYRELTGDQYATWREVFGDMYEGMIERLVSGSDTKALAERGFLMPSFGSKLYHGYTHKDLAKHLIDVQKDPELAALGGENPLEYESGPGDLRESYLKIDPWKDVKGERILKSLMMPFGFEMAVEWPGAAKKMNIESVISLQKAMPELASALGAVPEAGPGSGRPSKAWKSWLGVMKAFVLQESLERGEQVEHSGHLELGREALERIHEKLKGIPRENEMRQLSVISKELKAEWDRLHPDEDVPEAMTAFFPSAQRYLPTPGQAYGIDLTIDTAKGEQSKAHIISQYLRAFKDLSRYELFGADAGREALESHDRFLAGIHSRIGRTLGTGEDVSEKVLSRMIGNATSGHYFLAPWLGPGEAYVQPGEEGRYARASGLWKLHHQMQWQQYVQQKRGGTVPLVYQRYPVLNLQYGSLPVHGRTNYYYEQLGIQLPKNVGMLRGMLGMSYQATLPVQGDFDIDPLGSISAILVGWNDREIVDKKGRKRTITEPVFDDSAFERDVARRKAMGLDPMNASTYTEMEKRTLGSRWKEFDIIHKSMGELIDPKEGALKSAKRIGWTRAEWLQDAWRYYQEGLNSGGIMPMRGIAYNVWREFEVAMAGRDIDPKAYDQATANFALQYQNTLEYNLKAGQLTSIAAMLNQSFFELKPPKGTTPMRMVLKGVTSPRPSYDDPSAQNDWPYLMVSSGQQGTTEETAWSRYGDVVGSLAGEPDISDELLAAAIASDMGDYDANRQAVLERLMHHRASMSGKPEDRIAAGRMGALQGLSGGDSLLGGPIGPYSPYMTMVMSGALERLVRKAKAGDPEGDVVHIPGMIPWKGQWYSPYELYQTEEMESARTMRGLLTGHQRDRSFTALGTAGGLLRIAQGAKNLASGFARGVQGLIDYWGIQSVNKLEQPLTEEQLKEIQMQPAHMRASNISSILANMAMHPETDWRHDPMHHPHARKALIDIAARHLGKVLGVQDFPTTIFAQEQTQATILGNLTEEELEASGWAGIHIPQGQGENARSFNFRVGQTMLSGTPDYIKREGGRTKIIEVKRYSDINRGWWVAAIQSNLYGYGLEGLAQEKPEVGWLEKPEENSLYVKKKLLEWAVIAKEDAVKKQYDWARSFDPKKWAEEVFDDLKAGRVDHVPVVYEGRSGVMKYGKNLEPADTSGFDPVGQVKAVGNLIQENLPSLLLSVNTLYAGKRLPGLGELDPLLEGLDDYTAAKGVVGSNFPRQAAAIANWLTSKGVYTKSLEGDMASNNPERTMIHAGETVRTPSGESYTLLGDEGQRPGDTTTIADAARRGMFVPKEQLQRAASAIQFVSGNLMGPKEAERRARLLVSKNIKTYANAGSLFGNVQPPQPDDDNSPGGPPAGGSPPTLDNSEQPQQPNKRGSGSSWDPYTRPHAENLAWGAYWANERIQEILTSDFHQGILGALKDHDLLAGAVGADIAAGGISREALTSTLSPEQVQGLKEVQRLAGIVEKGTSIGVQASLDNPTKGATDIGGIRGELQGTGSWQPVWQDLAPIAAALGGGGKGGGGGGRRRGGLPKPEHFPGEFRNRLANLEREAVDIWQKANVPVDQAMMFLANADITPDVAQGIVDTLGKAGMKQLGRVASLSRHMKSLGAPVGEGAQAATELHALLTGLSPQGQSGTAANAAYKQALSLHFMQQLGGMTGPGPNATAADVTAAAQNMLAGISSGQITSEQVQALNSLMSVVGSGKTVPEGIGEGAYSLANVARVAKGMNKEAFKPPDAGAAPGEGKTFANLSMQEQSKLFDALNNSVEKLSSLDGTMTDLRKAVEGNTEISKDQIKTAKKQIERAESVGDIPTLRAQRIDTEAKLSKLIAGRDFEDLSPEERINALNLQRHRQMLKVQEHDQAMREAATMQAEQETESSGAKLGSALRTMFGGLGFFYLQRVAGMAMGDLTKGYAMTQQFEQGSWQTATQLFGTAAGPLQSDEIARQKALMRQGAGLGGSLAALDLSLTGTMLGEGTAALKSGAGGFLGGTFALAELSQADLISKKNVIPGAAMLALGAAVATPYLQQYGYIMNREQTILEAAVAQAKGGTMNEIYANWKTLGLSFLDAREGRWGPGPDGEMIPQAKAQRNAASEVLNRFKQGAPMAEDYNTPDKIRDLAHMLSMEGEMFEGISPEIVDRITQTMFAGGVTDYEVMNRLAGLTQAGIDIYGLAQTQAVTSGKLPTTQALAEEMAKVSTVQGAAEADIKKMGLGYMQGLGRTYLKAIGVTNFGLEARRFANISLQGYAPMLEMMANMYSDEVMAGEENADMWLKTPEEIESLWQSPEGKRAIRSDMLSWNRFKSLRDRMMTQYGGEVWQAFSSGVYSPLTTAFGARGATIAEGAQSVFGQIYTMTGQAATASSVAGSIARAQAMGQFGTANWMTGVLRGDPVAVQMGMLEQPEIASTMASFGFSQISDVSPTGQATGLPLYTTNFSATALQEIFGAGYQNTNLWQFSADNPQGGYVPKFAPQGTKPIFGTRGVQFAMSDLQYQAQMAQAGAQLAMIELQEEYLPKFWAIEDQQRALSYRQSQWGFGSQERQLAMQSEHFYQNFGLNVRQAQMQRGWSMEDWSYQDQVRNLQWGWKQEDFQENARFMTGRERRIAERGMERETVLHNLEGEQIDKQRDRQKELWELEDERFDLQRQQHEEQIKFQEEQIAMSRKFFEERWKLETKSIELHREFQLKQLELQKQAIGAQVHYAQAIHELNTEMALAKDHAEDLTAAYDMTVAYTNLLKRFAGDLVTIGVRLDALGYNIPRGQPPKDGEPVPQQYGGPFGGGQQLLVGETEPEVVRPAFAGYVTPMHHIIQDFEETLAMITLAQRMDSSRERNPWKEAGFIPERGIFGEQKSQPIYLTVNLGNERLGEFVLDTVNEQLEVR